VWWMSTASDRRKKFPGTTPRRLGCLAPSVLKYLCNCRISFFLLISFFPISYFYSGFILFKSSAPTDPALPFCGSQVMNTNLKSAFLLSQAAGAHMLPRRRGSIIHFASLLSFQGGLTVPAYAAAKGGIAQMVKALANEWSKENVRVNAVVPGYIKTDM